MTSRTSFVAVALLCLLAQGCGRLQPLSTHEALARLNIATSKVYDARGNVIADLHGEINRDIATYDQISPYARKAVVAIEDERFWQHQGLDLRSILRALASNLRHGAAAGRELQGGSTITQQLAKNLYFPRPARTLARKIAEARVTYQLERQYSKRKILEMYLNTVYLGRGVYGIETAAHSYFGKSASALTLSEAAFLAGLIHEPARYEWSPSDPPARQHERLAEATARRNQVLERMRVLAMISAAEARRAEREPLHIRPPQQSRWQHPYFVDYVLRELGVLRSEPDEPLDPRFDFLGTSFEERSRNVYRGGLRIYTTLDPEAQDAAEHAVASVLPRDLPRLEAALVAIEPSTGYVRALVGGRDYYASCPPHTPCFAKVNLALGPSGGGSGRQPGSSFKPFVLAAALERGIPLYEPYDSSPFTDAERGTVWTVDNYEGEGGGPMTVLDGTIHSVNAVYAHLEIDGVGDGDGFVGAARVAGLARRLGVSLPTPAELQARCGKNYLRTDACLPADDTPAIALGAKEVAPIDMASAYAVFANDGVRVLPTAIARITDARGRVLFDARPQSGRVLPAGVARGVTYALEQVVRQGTGVAAAIDRPAAGKTGTSENWTNAWFDGYVPQLAASVWVGNPATSTEAMTPANGYPFRIVGGTYPAEIWHAFMQDALRGIPPLDFPDPPQALFAGGGRLEAASPTPSPTPTAVLAPTPPSRERVPVPDVVGEDFGQAQATLTAAGFRPDLRRGCDPSGQAALHEVFRQSPAAGTPWPVGALVTVIYEGGNCPSSR